MLIEMLVIALGVAAPVAANRRRLARLKGAQASAETPRAPVHSAGTGFVPDEGAPAPVATRPAPLLLAEPLMQQPPPPFSSEAKAGGPIFAPRQQPLERAWSPPPRSEVSHE